MRTRKPRAAKSGSGSSGDQVLQPNWQIANTPTGCMIDRVHDRRSRTDVAEFTKPLDAGRIHVTVDLGDKDHLDVLNIGIHRDIILRKVTVPVGPMKPSPELLSGMTFPVKVDF